MAPYTRMPSMSANENNIIYSNSMKYNRNHLITRLLSGITNDELEKLTQIREEAKRSIPAPRIKKQAASSNSKNRKYSQTYGRLF